MAAGTGVTRGKEPPNAGHHTRKGAADRGETARASDAGYPNIASEIFGMASD